MAPGVAMSSPAGLTIGRENISTISQPGRDGLAGHRPLSFSAAVL